MGKSFLQQASQFGRDRFQRPDASLGSAQDEGALHARERGQRHRPGPITPLGVLTRDKQLGVVKELTEIIAEAAGDPAVAERTWVQLVESPDGGWGIAGHANTNADIAQAVRRALGKA